jgi:hypothetical protein
VKVEHGRWNGYAASVEHACEKRAEAADQAEEDDDQLRVEERFQACDCTVAESFHF